MRDGSNTRSTFRFNARSMPMRACIRKSRQLIAVCQLIAAKDAVGISSVNIPANAEYCGIDSGAIAKAEAAGAKIVTSVETTHGVIRAMWPEAPFAYVTAIPNRVCHFPDEAMNSYAQEFPSSHNAGVALKHVISDFVGAISP